MAETYEDRKTRAAINVRHCVYAMKHGAPAEQMAALECLTEGLVQVQDDDSEAVSYALDMGVIQGPDTPRVIDDSAPPVLRLPYYPKGGWDALAG